MFGPVVEVVTWCSKVGVSDEQMMTAVDAKLPDVRQVDGFLHQSLYKNSQGE